MWFAANLSDMKMRCYILYVWVINGLMTCSSECTESFVMFNGFNVCQLLTVMEEQLFSVNDVNACFQKYCEKFLFCAIEYDNKHICI